MRLQQIIKWIKNVIKLNSRIDNIYNQLQDINQTIEKQNQTIEKQNQTIKKQNQTIEKQNRTIEVLNKKMDEELINNNNIIQATLRTEMDIRQQQLEGKINQMFDVGFNNMLQNGEMLSRLNRELSTHITIWGDESRVHVSPLASVGSCLINVNSGMVEIGDYTFAGSNVSILAGSHDIRLKGFVRRDIEFTKGCDIKIGKGVWLASNSVVIGPCSIGDNAVIAAGAVVVPGTVVPENAVYAGVPARMISTIEFFEDGAEFSERNVSFMNALSRNGGIVFSEGISEKKTIVYDDRIYYGGWKNKDEIKAYTCNKENTLLFYAENNLEYTLFIESDDVEEKICIKDQFMYVKVNFENCNDVNKVKFRIDNNDVKLFVGYRSAPLK